MMSIFDSFSQFGKCKTGHSHIADYNLANDTLNVSFCFKFLRVKLKVEIIDKTFKELICALHNKEIHYFCRYVWFFKSECELLCSVESLQRQTETLASFLSCQRPGWGHQGWNRLKWWRHHFRHPRIFLSNIIHVNIHVTLVVFVQQQNLVQVFFKTLGTRNFLSSFFNSVKKQDETDSLLSCLRKKKLNFYFVVLRFSKNHTHYWI